MADVIKRWWRYAVLRGEGLPVHLDGLWFDLDAMPSKDLYVFEAEGGHPVHFQGISATLLATNQWEQRENGEVAVVYRWSRG